jgi:hypothetical protein
VSVAKSIREFFTDLFGSKLIERLSTDLAYLRQDFEQRLRERDETISELRSEKAALNLKISMYEVNINRRVGIDPTAKRAEKPSWDFNSPPMKSAWQSIVEEHDKKNAKELEEEAAAVAAK